ncbi:MAG: DUF1735 domain-containing protein [Ferruginibacter sp.]
MKLKPNKWIGSMVVMLVVLASLNSCVKDRNELGTDFGKIVNVVDLPVIGFKALSFEVTPDPQLVKIYVELGGPIQNSDVEVTLAFDQAGLDVYNAAHTDTTVTATNPNPIGTVTHFEKLADAAFTLPNLTATIKKGERLGVINLTIIPNKVDLSVQNAIALKIVDAKGIAIADNLKSVIYAIVVKNEWEADYDVTGWFFHPSAGRAIKAVKHLSTVNGIRVEASVADLGTPFQFDVTGNAAVNWFSDGFTSSSFMTADNPGATDFTNSSNGGHIPGDATFNKTIYNNTYDPATKTFYLHYGYVNGAVAGQTGYTRQAYEKWVRK